MSLYPRNYEAWGGRVGGSWVSHRVDEGKLPFPLKLIEIHSRIIDLILSINFDEVILA
jgi:hypothetical protein